MGTLLRWLLLACGVISVLGEAGKKKQFRMDKMNYIYSKALQHIDDKKQLKQLEDKLDEFDKLYAHNKELSGSGKVDAKADLVKIDEKLLKLLYKFNLEKTLDAFHQKRKFHNDHEQMKENLALPSEKFTDPRLQKLWMTAQTGKFSSEELNDLHRALKEQERKMAHYEELAREFNKVWSLKVIGILQAPEEETNDVLEEGMGDRTRRLKEAHREAHDHLEKLHARINDAEKSSFKTDKVRSLWKSAQQNKNFSATDLQSLKEELSHFDLQLQKLSLHGEQLDQLRESRKKAGKTNAFDNLEHQELEARHEKLSRKLKKMEKFIVHKIEHTEL